MHLRLAILALVLGSPLVADAQRGKYGALALQLPASTRAMALGDAYVATRDVESLFYNPAQLVGGRTGAAASVQRFGDVGELGSLAGVTSLGSTAGVGVGVQFLGHDMGPGDYPLAPGSLARDDELRGWSVAATLAGTIVFRGVRWGLGTKYVADLVDERGDGGFLVDVGAAKEIGPVSLGVAAQNLGVDFNVQSGGDGRLPTRITAGVASGGLPLGPFDVSLLTSVAMRRDTRITPAAGAEFSWSPLDGITGFGRFGVHRPERGAESALSVGTGFTFDRLSVDYAFAGFEGPGSTHRLGLRIR